MYTQGAWQSARHRTIQSMRTSLRLFSPPPDLWALLPLCSTAAIRSKFSFQEPVSGHRGKQPRLVRYLCKKPLSRKKPNTGREEFKFILNKGLDPSLNIGPCRPGSYTEKKSFLNLISFPKKRRENIPTNYSLLQGDSHLHIFFKLTPSCSVSSLGYN